MTDSKTEEPTTWEESREQAIIRGTKRTIPDQQRQEIERRSEGH